MGLPAVKEFREHSTKLEFDGSDAMATDGGLPGDKDKGQPPSEEVDEDGKGEECVEYGESECKLRKTTKLSAVDEYQWQ